PRGRHLRQNEGGDPMRTRVLRILATGVTLCLAQFSLAQFAAAQGVTADKIVLGQAAVFTGPAAQLGIQMRNGIKAYFDFVNEKGGVNGRKLELVTEDDQYEQKVAPIA